MKLCMIGTGYVGLVSGVCFSDLGNTVYCVDNNSDKVTLKYIIKGFEFNYYLTKHNAEMYYKIMMYGNDKVKASWKRYILLNSKWLPTATSEQKRKELKARLMEWAHAKTN